MEKKVRLITVPIFSLGLFMPDRLLRIDYCGLRPILYNGCILGINIRI